jgi:hypothetical protein
MLDSEMDTKDLLQRLAHYVVRNEIVNERYLVSRGLSMDEIGATVREVDEQLKRDTDWQNRFPGLFSE